MKASWIRDALMAAAAVGVHLSIEPGGISIWAKGEWMLRTWHELDTATSDCLTPSVDAIRRRVERKSLHT